MQRARALENNRQPVNDRGADASAPRSKPLTLVEGAVAGDDLQSVARTVAEALGCPVAIAIPALGEPVVRPEGSLTGEATVAIAAYAVAIGEGLEATAPAPVVEAVPVRIGEQVVGIVAATAPVAGDPLPEQRAWLEAAATAASVTALIRDAHAGGAADSSEALLAELASGPPEDVTGFLIRARRLGIDLTAGAVALSARAADGNPAGPTSTSDLPAAGGVLVASPCAGRVLAVAPVPSADGPDPGGEFAAGLRARGMVVAISAPRRDPALLHEAVREAELLAELGGSPEEQAAGHDETYRLLIGVLLRDRAELEQLRDSTITPLADYDARHDTDLLATLRAFLSHDGSTTETADAMKLHRHTVGYRLSRVHEVSGLSPYESDGRERLSLGIKAHQILDAELRLQQTSVRR
jgi:hypothetical protein